MTKLLYAPASPYSAKARMAAVSAGIAIEEIVVDTGAEPAILIDNNPLGKIPVLITDDGESVYDSRAITQYLNRVSGGALFPRNAAKRTQAEQLEALGDGLCDCLLAHVYERRFRSEDMVQQSWLDKQWAKAVRALDHLNANPPRLSKRPNAGHLALRAALGYLELRFAEAKWERKRGKLVRWKRRFDEKFPDLAAVAPRQP